jgi:predicted RNA-binding Zn-ribbon protein involved in translation (DUF1610 family)
MADLLKEKTRFQRRLHAVLAVVVIPVGCLAVSSILANSFDLKKLSPQLDELNNLFMGGSLLTIIGLLVVYMFTDGISFLIPRLFCPHCQKHIEDQSGWYCPFCKNLNKYSLFANTILFRCQKCKRESPAYKCHECGEVSLLVEKGDTRYCATTPTAEERKELGLGAVLENLPQIAAAFVKLKENNFDVSKAELSLLEDQVAIERKRQELERVQNRPRSEEERMKEELDKRVGQIRAKLKAVRSSADIFMELGKYQNEINGTVDANPNLTGEQKARIKETVADQLKRVVMA